MFIISCFSNKAGFLYTCYKGLYKRTKLPGGVASELKMDNAELSPVAQAVHSHRGRNTVKKKEFTNSRPGKPGFVKGAAEARMLPLCSGWRPGPRPGRVAPPPPSSMSRSHTRAVGRGGGRGRQPGDAADLAAGAGTGRPKRVAGGHGAERRVRILASSQPRVPGGVHATQVVQAVGGGHQRVHFALPAFKLGQVVQAGHDGSDRLLHQGDQLLAVHVLGLPRSRERRGGVLLRFFVPSDDLVPKHRFQDAIHLRRERRKRR